MTFWPTRPGPNTGRAELEIITHGCVNTYFRVGLADNSANLSGTDPLPPVDRARPEHSALLGFEDR
jgi:hypothetical protein